MTKQTLVHKKADGFTLIEAVIYIALFAIIIGGAMVATYQIIEGSDRLKIKTVIEQEANFILRKIDWAITNAQSLDGAGSMLTVTYPVGDPVVFSLDVDGNLEKDGTDLNISSIKISDLTLENFEETLPSGKKLDGIKVTFVASSLDGRASQTFTETKYVKVPKP